MVGLIWLVQLVHYPLFAQVGRSAYPDYHRTHTSRITWIVAPAMLIEAILTVGCVLALPSLFSALAAALLAVAWLSTFLIQVPLHGRLTQGLDLAILRRLVTTNWIRTAAWSGRGVLSLLMVAQAVELASRTPGPGGVL